MNKFSLNNRLCIRIIQFAQTDEWTLLCDTLAARLIAAGDTAAATLCYVCAGNIDKAVEMWSKSLTQEHDGKTYIDRLQVRYYKMDLGRLKKVVYAVLKKHTFFFYL